MTTDKRDALTETKTRPAHAERYDPRAIEAKWQERWEADGLYTVREDRTKPKFYCLDFFPYPSGDGLSVGHCRNYVPTDTISRYMRMRGYNVLHPMGWDAFGLPAENEAILKGRHPKLTVPQYTANYKRQLKLIGTSYDWTREINSSEPDYYRWTQWFFLFLYERGLAYRSTAPANWCPLDGTVLANEEVIDGACWRCGTTVVKKSLPQWFFKITAYADRLLDDLETVDWPEKIVRMQRHWIGRSEGADLSFELNAPGVTDRELRVFTTRPDTVYGVTFMVLAPEHPLVDKLTTPEQLAEMTAYVEQASLRTEIDRLSTEREKTGVFTGAYVTNRFNGERVPVWVADYVILTYGTGAIMGVPGHDQRDFDFAKTYGLRILPVYEPPDWDGGELTEALVHAGAMINSGRFDGLPEERAIEAITKYAEEMGYGARAITYRLRDWLISRQRYWGAPIPIVYCKRCGEVPVPMDALPVLLPDIDEYAPSGTGRSPLANVPEFVNTMCPRCREPAERETDTMGGFACSSWYFLRFASPHYADGPFEPEAMRFWLPVDLYVGGAEHAVMHLLYARFWTKVAYDAELLHFNEPFTRLMNQGIVHAADGKRMSKSQGNVITPDSVVERHGADSLRGYELFIAPFEMNVSWSDEGVRGINRWLHRVWNVALGAMATAALPDAPETRELRRWTHRTIARVTDDMERFHFNTMLSALMEFTNYLTKLRETNATVDAGAWREALESLLLLAAPAAPHIAEELWARAGRPYSVHQQAWPASDAALAAEDVVEIAVQVNGKVREHLTLPLDAPEERAREAALASERVRPHVEGREIVRVIYVPNRLLNVVVR